MFKFRTTKVIDENSHIYNFLPLVTDISDIREMPLVTDISDTSNSSTGASLFEIDVLFRIHHPYIMHADKFVLTADGPGIMLPAIDSISFTSILNKTTKEKIPLLYKILRVYKFLDENLPKGGFAMRDIIFTENNDIVIFVSEMNTNITDIIRSIMGDLILVSDKYQNDIENLFTMEDKLKSKIFDPYREDIQFAIVGASTNDRGPDNVRIADVEFTGEYPPDTREIIKSMIILIRDNFENWYVEHLFLAIELYRRVIPYYFDNSYHERNLVMFACVYMASQFAHITRGENALHIITHNSHYATGYPVTKNELIDRQNEILKIINGVININKYYNRANNRADLIDLYKNVIMNKDVSYYNNDWYPSSTHSEASFRLEKVEQFF